MQDFTLKLNIWKILNLKGHLIGTKIQYNSALPVHVAFIVQYMTLDDEPVNFLEEVFGAQLMALTKQCEQPDKCTICCSTDLCQVKE